MNIKLTGLSILSGLLLGLAWPETGGFTFLIFIGFLPLLYVEHIVSLQSKRYTSLLLFCYAYLSFLIFNTFTTWWIWYSSEGGVIMAEVLYSLFMATIFLWFHAAKKQLGNKRGYIALVVFWIGFEWVHYNWEFSHPWNTLGNAFANQPKIIQWYEYTGVLGGSFWVLLVNLLFFYFLLKLINGNIPLTNGFPKNKKHFGCGITQTNHLFSRKSVKFEYKLRNEIKIIIVTIAVILTPIIYSFITYNNYIETENPIEIVIVQPNIDPYVEKFGGLTEEEQITKILELASKKVTSKTAYLVAPETAIPRAFVENYPEESYGLQAINRWISNFKNLTFVIGASTYIEYPKSDHKPTPTVRYDRQTGGWYDAYNSALQLNNRTKMQIYHKSKLVLGVEKIPYPTLFSPLESFAINLGGTIGSLGVEKEAFNFINDSIRIAPVICYESIYGEYFSTYVKKGAQAVFIITNDGWWDDSPGYKQHLAYARLRAIETRRSIARSANTGISCFINQRGDIIQQSTWWKSEALKGTINLNNKQTFYTQSGDWIGRVFAALAVLLLAWSWGTKLASPTPPKEGLVS